ncbi:MAG: ACP S-malonyltransferase [Simkaniaceae bacterium]
MYKKTAFIFPGQGAQYVGMGKDFSVQFPLARQTFEEADELLGLSLSRLIFDGPEDELTLTKNSQIAIYVTSIAVLRVLKKEYAELSPDICAGLSLGEYTALTAAGFLPFSEGVKLVRQRGELMHRASASHPGTMAAILGMEEKPLQEILEKENLSKEVWIANLNCPGQIVISGTKSGVGKAMTLLKDNGAKRAIELDVSGAFHSGLMQEAELGLQQTIAQTSFTESSIPIAMNVTGTFSCSIEEIRKNLLKQLTSPVRWQKSVETMKEMGIEAFYEIGPGKTLQGMNRKIGLGSSTTSLEKAQDFEKLMVER